jgi:hypothetical protein
MSRVCITPSGELLLLEWYELPRIGNNDRTPTVH